MRHCLLSLNLMFVIFSETHLMAQSQISAIETSVFYTLRETDSTTALELSTQLDDPSFKSLKDLGVIAYTPDDLWVHLTVRNASENKQNSYVYLKNAFLLDAIVYGYYQIIRSKRDSR